MSKKNSNGNISHRSTVQQIIEVAQATWKKIIQMNSSDEVNPEGVFINNDKPGQTHPQKEGHSYLLGYHNMMANKTYWIKAADLWQEPITNEAGNAITVEVPAQPSVKADGDVTLDMLETKKEKLTLETLAHRWAFRYINVEREISDSWGNGDTEVEQKRVWLPPRAIYYAFEQFEEVRSKIKLAADIETPGWQADEPIEHIPAREAKNESI